MLCILEKFFAVSILLVSPGSLWSAAVPSLRVASQSNLRRMTRQSGYIFAGTVISVQSKDSPTSVPTMEITFHVDQAIRGVSKGQTLVIHEWAGVWETGETYKRGEHVLLFLYRPSKLGLTSPVGGQQGHLKLDSKGMTVLRMDRAADWFPKSAFSPDWPVRSHIGVGDVASAIHQAEDE